MNELTARVWQRGIFYCQPKYVDGDHGGIWGLSLTRCLQIRFWYWAVPRCPCKPSVAGYAVPQASSTCWITSHSAGFIYLCHVLNPVQHTDELFCILNISCDIFNYNTVNRCNGPIKWCGYLVSSRYCFGVVELSIWVLILAGVASLWMIALPSPTFSICRVCADTCAMKFNEQVNLDRVAVVLHGNANFADNATSSLWGMYYIHTTQAHKCWPIF